MFWAGVLVGFFVCLSVLGIWSMFSTWLSKRKLNKEIREEYGV